MPSYLCQSCGEITYSRALSAQAKALSRCSHCKKKNYIRVNYNKRIYERL